MRCSLGTSNVSLLQIPFGQKFSISFSHLGSCSLTALSQRFKLYALYAIGSCGFHNGD